MSLMLALETLGLSSCAINWPDIPEWEDAIGAALELRRSDRVIMLVAAGFADPEGRVAYSEKRPLSQFRIFSNGD